MEKTRKQPHILRNILLTILAVLILLVCVVWGLWHNEIMTVASMHRIIERNDAHLDGSVYIMEVHGDYYFDDFIAQGGRVK